jgi:hypothetical protein
MPHAKQEYMQHFSHLFEAELLDVYGSGASVDAVQQLRACIEAGASIWGHPITIPDPIL